MGREVGRGFRMGNTCTPVVDSCWCVAEPIQYCKVKKIQNKTKPLDLRLGKEMGEGFRMGNTSTPMANSCWCVAEPIQYCKVKKIKIKIHWKKKFHGQESLVGYSYGTAKSQTWLIDWAHYIFTLCIKLVVDFT